MGQSRCDRQNSPDRNRARQPGRRLLNENNCCEEQTWPPSGRGYNLDEIDLKKTNPNPKKSIRWNGNRPKSPP